MKQIGALAAVLIIVTVVGCESNGIPPESAAEAYIVEQAVTRLDPAEEIQLSLERSTYWLFDQKFVFSINNDRAEPWYYGHDFVFEVKAGEEWYPAGAFLGEVPAVESILEPKQTITLALEFTDYFKELSPGHYRLVMNPNFGEWAAAEFDIMSEDEVRHNIIGSWKTDANVIGASGLNPTAENCYVLSFVADGTGTEKIITNNEENERSFTYTVLEYIIQIEFESGPVWQFPFDLDSDQLILTQHHQEVIYNRI